jgi:excisionase family DNA binding protein
MNLEQRLRRIAECLPPGAAVVLGTESLGRLLSVEPDGATRPSRERPGLTVIQVAERYGRAPSTVRGWIRDGRLNAYRLGREYRVDPEAIDEFDAGLRGSARIEPRQQPSGEPDLGAWRRSTGSAVE